MPSRAPTTAPIVTAGDLGANAASFARNLRASNLTLATIATYVASVQRFADYLEDHGTHEMLSAGMQESDLMPCRLAESRDAPPLCRVGGV